MYSVNRRGLLLGCLLFMNATFAQNDYLEQIEAEAMRLAEPGSAAPTSSESVRSPESSTPAVLIPPQATSDDAASPTGAVVSRSDPRAREFERHLSSIFPGAHSLYSLLNDIRKLEAINLYVDSPRSGDERLVSAIERIRGYYYY